MKANHHEAPGIGNIKDNILYFSLKLVYIIVYKRNKLKYNAIVVCYFITDKFVVILQLAKILFFIFKHVVF